LFFIVSISTYISIPTKNLQEVFTPSTFNGFEYDFIQSVLNNSKSHKGGIITFKATLQTNGFQFTQHKSPAKCIYITNYKSKQTRSC